MVAIVPISTYTNDLCDQTCVVVVGEHAFVRHKSYVLYRKARTIGCDEVSRGIEGGTFKTHDDMNAQTFLRIRNGICKSIATSPTIKKYMGCPPPAAAIIF